MFTQYPTSIAIESNARGLVYRSRLMGLLVVCLGGLLGLGAASQAKAVTPSSCTGGNFTETLLATTIVPPRDAAIPSLISNWITSSANAYTWMCNAYSTTSKPAPYLAVGAQFDSARSDTGKTITTREGTYTIYDTGYSGLGIIVDIQISMAGTCNVFRDLGNLTPSSKGGACYIDHEMAFSSSIGPSIRVAFVKTGNILPGMLPSIPVASAMPSAGVASDIYHLPNPSYPGARVYYRTAVTAISAGTCDVDDVTVPLGENHLLTELPSVASTTKAVDFKIALTNCPAGMAGIDYRIDAKTNLMSKSSAVVELDANSTARGVGVQLLDTNGNPFTLLNSGTLTTLSSYTGVAGNYNIPLKARYYRTGTVSGGTANTNMTFTMSYR